jgi:PEGA domain
VRSNVTPRTRPLVAVLAAALSTACWLCPERSFAQDNDGAVDVDEQVRKLIANSDDAVRRGQLVEAEKFLQAAWDLKPGYDVGANLGATEHRIGQLHQAALHLAYSLKHYPATANLKKKAALQKLLDEVRAHVGRVDVTVNIERAQVFVDSVLVGVAPLDLPIFVTPGNHTIEAKRDGYTMAAQSITATAGSTQKAMLTLELLPSSKPDGNGAQGTGNAGSGGVGMPPGGSSVVTPPGGDGPVAPDPVWMAVTGGLAAVGIGLGIGFTVAANGKGDDAASLQQPGGTSGCFGRPEAPGCADLFEAREDQSALSNAALASFVAGGAFALGTVGLAVWTWTGSGPSRQGGVHVGPAVSATHGGVLIRGLW